MRAEPFHHNLRHHGLRRVSGAVLATVIVAGGQTAGHDDQRAGAADAAVPALLDGDIVHGQAVIARQIRAALGHELTLPADAFVRSAEFRPEAPRPSQRIGVHPDGAHPENGLLLQPMPLFRLQRQAGGHCQLLQLDNGRVWSLEIGVSCRPALGTR